MIPTMPTSHRTRRPRRAVLRSLVLVGALVGLLTAFPGARVGAAPIDDLRAKAAEVEGQMNDVGAKLGVLYEQIKSTEYQMDQAKQTIAASQAGIAAAQGEVDRITALVRQRAASVYRKAGARTMGMFDTDIREQASRRKYASATNERDDRLLDQLDEAKEDLAAKQAVAERLRAEVQQQQETLKAQQAEFEQQKAELDRIKSGIDGQIAQLVAEEQARRRAAEAAAAAASRRLNAGAGSSQFDPSKVPPASGRAGIAVAFAQAQLGKPYCYAGKGPDCFDCSGLTQQAWAAAGISLPGNSEAQFGSLPRVPLSEVQPGDIVWFPGHVGIYAGGGAVINATHTGDVVRIHPLSLYQGAVRPG